MNKLGVALQTFPTLKEIYKLNMLTHLQLFMRLAEDHLDMLFTCYL